MRPPVCTTVQYRRADIYLHPDGFRPVSIANIGAAFDVAESFKFQRLRGSREFVARFGGVWSAETPIRLRPPFPAKYSWWSPPGTVTSLEIAATSSPPSRAQ